MSDAKTPGEAVEATGLSLDTLRYYEREGLIGPIARASNGQRSYSQGDLAWIGVVTCLRNAGLGIDDLRSFTAMLRTSEPTGSRVEFLRERKAALLGHIEKTRQAIGVLDEKIAHYSALEAAESKIDSTS